ncbi:MAG: hypothetical protein OCD00_09045 [Colwellia sp.]
MSIIETLITETKTSLKRQSKGERTKEKILLSAIEVLAINGIKGTTHRAIANHAKLQLSLTTYYFKDIQELILQAFQLNTTYLKVRTKFILEKYLTFLKEEETVNLKKISVKADFCEQLTEITANYLFENIKKEAVPLAVEQLMFTTVQVTPELKKLAHEHELSLLEPFEKLCRYFNNKDPEVDAKIMRTVFSDLQYSQLPLRPDELSITPIKSVTKKLMAWIMGLKN